MKPIIIHPMLISRALKIMLALAALVLLGLWLARTPPGLLGKIDAIGYSVCHQAPARSFSLGERSLPLCARCSGMFLGAMVGMIYLLGVGRRGGFPPLRVSLVLMFSAAVWVLDGANSFARLLPFLPHLYESQNWLRLASGTGFGLGISAVLVPVFNQTVWIDYQPAPALGSFRSLAGLFAAGAIGALGIYSGWPILTYPLAVISGLGVLSMLTSVYTVIWVLLSRSENRYHTIKELWVPLLAGFITALLQVSAIDAFRLWITGSWGGIPLPN